MERKRDGFVPLGDVVNGLSLLVVGQQDRPVNFSASTGELSPPNPLEILGVKSVPSGKASQPVRYCELLVEIL